MRNVLAVSAAALLLLAGCGDSGPRYGGRSSVSHPSPMASRGGYAPAEPEAQRANFSYNHFLSIAMDAAFVSPRFKRARDLCLTDKSYSCELLASNFNQGNEDGDVASSAQLTVMLPHDKVDAFAEGLIAPIGEESASSVKIRARSTTAENVTQQVTDVGRRLTQLTDYRDRLTALSKRSDVRAAELIQLAEALSKVQAEIDAATAQQRDAEGRVAKERLTIELAEREGANVLRPITYVLNSAGSQLIDSAASALSFLIRSLPWLPIAAAAIMAIAWLWRRVRGARPRGAGVS
jgi:hypothetical protein